MDIISFLKSAEQNSGIIGSVAASILFVLGWLSKQVYSGMSKRITMAHDHARSAAEAAALAEEHRREDIKGVHENLNDHIQRDVDMHREVLGALGEQTSTLHGIHASLLSELGKRPTREEVDKSIEAVRQFAKQSKGK